MHNKTKDMDIVDKLMSLRLDWTFEDYKESYSDEWCEMPTTISGCREKMEEYIRNTYDKALILDCIENEQ